MGKKAKSITPCVVITDNKSLSVGAYRSYMATLTASFMFVTSIRTTTNAQAANCPNQAVLDAIPTTYSPSAPKCRSKNSINLPYKYRA